MQKMVRSFEEKTRTLRLGIELVHRAVSDDEYQQIVDRIDVLLLPYKIDRYRRKGSGVAQEALANAIPFVCSAGTALVDFLIERNGETG